MTNLHSLLAGLGAMLSLVVQSAEPITLTLDSFTDGKGGKPGAAWVTEADGSIHLNGKGGGNLISKQEFVSFEITWEWKLTEGGNNGLKYWVTEIGEKKEWLGIEYQMIDDHKNADGLRGGSHTTASIYDIKEAAADKPLKPIGEWNRSRVVIRQGVIEHWLNGKQVVTADTNTPEWKALVAKSKFKLKRGFAPGRGRFMLTDHGDPVWFRSLRVTPL